MENNNIKIYKIGGVKRPVNSFKQKLALKLYSTPVFNKFKWVKKYLCKEFNLPLTTSISKGFYCSAPLLQVGENTGLGDTFIIAYAPITIGEGCSFSFKNTIITSTHDFNNFSTVIAKPVTIGNNVWITTNVTIGDNTVIGAGSVVTKDIPSGVFAAGNPCRVIKRIDLKK